MAANETRDRCPPTIREPEFPRGRDDIASRFASQRFRAPESYSVNVVIITIGRGPATVCDVVYQNDNWINKCQFSFACDGIPDVIADRGAYRLAKDVAMAVSGGKVFLPEVASSTHYNATYVSPRWARSMERMTQIGSHIFYRTFGGGWS